MPYTLNVGCRHWAVNLTAWAFVLGGAAAAVLALLQNAVLGSLLPLWKAGPLPTATAMLVQNMPWVLGLVGALSLLLMVAGIGLVLRLEWARRMAIGLLVVSIVASLAGLWLQHEVVHALVSRAADVAALPAAVRGLFSGFAVAAQALAVMLTLAACLLLAWVVRLLRSPSVRQEFA